MISFIFELTNCGKEQSMEYNVYCDESCHLENDNTNVMAIGAVYCPKDKIKEVSNRIREIKIANGIPKYRELKWTKVSAAKLDVYRDLINYFFNNSDLHFRAIIIPDKTKLNHQRYKQTHDDWYYKMYYDMLKTVFNISDSYNVYIDIKDTNSYMKSKELLKFCRIKKGDAFGKVIKKLQPIRSEEVQIMQLADLLIGSLTHYNRYIHELDSHSNAKLNLIEMIKANSGHSLRETTYYSDRKFNILVWEANYGEK